MSSSRSLPDINEEYLLASEPSLDISLENIVLCLAKGLLKPHTGETICLKKILKLKALAFYCCYSVITSKLNSAFCR